MWKTHLETKQEANAIVGGELPQAHRLVAGGLNQCSAYLVGPAGLEPATKGL